MPKTKRQREKTKTRYSNTKKWVDDSSGGFEPTSFELPEGMSSFRWKKGKNRLDFIPFVVTSDHNPEAEKGEVHWNRLYRVHDKIGPEEKRYACLSNWGKTCPICINLAKDWRKADTDKDLLDAQKQKDRRLFYVKDLDDKEDKGVQVLETGHYKTFGEMMRDELDALADGDPGLDFFHLEDGMTVEVMCKEDTFNGRKFNKPYKITLVERDEQYESDMLDEIPSLDEVVKQIPTKKLENLYKMEDDSDDDDEEQDEKPRKKKKVRDEEEEDEDEDEAPVKKKKKVRDEDVLDFDDEDDEKPKKKKKKKVEEDEDDQDDEEDDSDDNEDEDDSDSDDDEEDLEDEEEDDDSDGDDGEEQVAVGDLVTWKYRGKKLKGRVSKINKKNNIAMVKVKGQDRPSTVDLDELNLIGEEEPKPKKKPIKKAKKKSREEDDEDDLDFDDDDSLPFDEEDEDDDEPAPNKKKKRR